MTRRLPLPELLDHRLSAFRASSLFIQAPPSWCASSSRAAFWKGDPSSRQLLLVEMCFSKARPPRILSAPCCDRRVLLVRCGRDLKWEFTARVTSACTSLVSNPGNSRGGFGFRRGLLGDRWADRLGDLMLGSESERFRASQWDDEREVPVERCLRG